jgi:16S rRNA (guanine966-N2)-methyltransferase
MPDAGRVIAGTARSIRLQGVGPDTRPLADRVKQTAFAILEPGLRDSRFLDLFAGSGAAGIEALSRGAARVSFVDQAPDAVAAIHANLERTHLAGTRAHVVRTEALEWLADARPSADLAIVDPPYDRPDLLEAALRRLGEGGRLAPGANVVAKHGSRVSAPARIGLLASTRERRFGETALTFYEAVDPAQEGS